MRYQIQFGDSGLHAIAGIHWAVSEALEAHFGDAEAVMRAYTRCVAVVGKDTRFPPPDGATEFDRLAVDVWVRGEALALRQALLTEWPGMDDESSRETLGNCFLVLGPANGGDDFTLPLPF